MRRSRCSEEQIIGVRREQEAGMKVAEVCRKHGIPALPSPSVRVFIDHLSAELPKRSLTVAGVGRERLVRYGMKKTRIADIWLRNRLRGKKPSKSEEKVEPDRCF